jgi:hypothetical protein
VRRAVLPPLRRLTTEIAVAIVIVATDVIGATVLAIVSAIVTVSVSVTATATVIVTVIVIENGSGSGIDTTPVTAVVASGTAAAVAIGIAEEAAVLAVLRVAPRQVLCNACSVRAYICISFFLSRLFVCPLSFCYCALFPPSAIAYFSFFFLQLFADRFS